MTHDPHRWQHKDAIPEHLTIKFKPGFSLEHEGVQALMGAHEAVHRKIIRPETHSLHVPILKSEALAKRLIDAGLVEYAEPDMIMRQASTIPNDIATNGQMGIPGSVANFYGAWDITKGSASIPVADIGTGADTDHPELAGKIVTGWNFVDSNNDTNDTQGHGTVSAGRIAILTDNASGNAGFGWNTPVRPIKVTNGSSTTSADLATAIDWVRNNTTDRVINISYAGTSDDTTLATAISDAWNAGIIITAAAGESSSNAAHYPAANTNVVGVAECNGLGEEISSTNYGSWCAIACQGQDYGIEFDGTSGHLDNGTSFAAPIVAACLALMLNVKPSYTATALRADLLAAGLPTKNGAYGSPTFGFGTPPLPGVMLNAYQACDLARGPRRASVAVGGF